MLDLSLPYASKTCAAVSFSLLLLELSERELCLEEEREPRSMVLTKAVSLRDVKRMCVYIWWLVKHNQTREKGIVEDEDNNIYI